MKGTAPAATVETLSMGALVVDLARYRVTRAGRPLALSRSQMELLAMLLANRDRVVSRAELSKGLGLARERSVDVLLSGLRRVIGEDFVRNVRNRGWIVEPAAFAPGPLSVDPV
jgi:DNA-binding response OmpR family regulator